MSEPKGASAITIVSSPPAERRGRIGFHIPDYFGRFAPWAVVVAAMALSFGLGAHDLTARPVTEDEAAGRSCASPTGLGVLCEKGDQSLYYLLSRLITHEFGPSIDSLRLVSVVAAVATVPIVFCIGRRLAGARMGIYAAVLFAVSLPMIVWQQNARGYVFGTLLGTASCWAFLAWRNGTQRWITFVYFGSIVVACYALYFNALIVAAELVSLLLAPGPRVPLRRVLSVLGPAVLVCLPLAYLAGHGQGAGAFAWVPRPGLSSLPGTALALMSASSADGPATTTPIAAPLGYLCLGVCLLLVASAVHRAFRYGRNNDTWAVLLAALWLVLPPAAVFVVSQSSVHLYVDRYFTVCLPAAALLLALALDRIRHPVVGLVALVSLAAGRLSLIPPSYAVPFDGTWQAVAASVMSGDRPGDCITFSQIQTPFTIGSATYLAYWADHTPGDGALPEPVLPKFSWLQARSGSFSMPVTQESFSSVRASCRRLWVVIVQAYEPSQYIFVNSEIEWFATHGFPSLVVTKWNEVHLVLMQPR